MTANFPRDEYTVRVLGDVMSLLMAPKQKSEDREVECPYCKGEGEILPRNEKPTSPNTIRCRACKGSGVVLADDEDGSETEKP